MSERLSRDDVFMAVAFLFAHRATCPRSHVGAVIVRDSHILAHGYNGSPPGMPHCTDVGCDIPERYHYEEEPEGFFHWDRRIELGCQRAVHAEANALAYAARVGVSCSGATLYTTHEPCIKCAQLIVGAGIQHVVWDQAYREGATDFLKEAGLKVTTDYHA